VVCEDCENLAGNAERCCFAAAHLRPWPTEGGYTASRGFLRWRETPRPGCGQGHRRAPNELLQRLAFGVLAGNAGGDPRGTGYQSDKRSSQLIARTRPWNRPKVDLTALPVRPECRVMSSCSIVSVLECTPEGCDWSSGLLRINGLRPASMGQRRCRCTCSRSANVIETHEIERAQPIDRSEHSMCVPAPFGVY